MSFIHLHTHSAYSLAEGAIPVKDMVKLCVKHKMPAVAITDTGNLFGAMEFALEAQKNGIQPIIGAEIKLADKSELVLLVQDDVGYKNLSRLVSQSFLEVDPTAEAHVTWEQLAQHQQGLICLSGALRGCIGQALLNGQKDLAEDLTQKLKAIFADRFYIELQRHNLPDEDNIEDGLIDLAYAHDIPLVATNNCYFPAREMVEAHDALLCIAGGRYISEADRRRETPDHYFKSAKEMSDLFADLPEAIQNTTIVAQRCHFLLKVVDPILPPFTSGKPEIEELKDQSKKGLIDRLKDSGLEEKPYFDRMEFELQVIEKMGYPGYFLIVSDFIKWAKANNIPVGPGRGSGAGSVVAWALQITDIDPLRFNLLFERFLNPERISMPDFDVDFCQDRRDEVIQYVQERYGRDKVAQIITFGKLQARAVVRDVGRVLQMPYGQVDRIAKMIPNNPANPTTLAEALEQDADLRAERDKDETTNRLITIALQLEGLYRHASTHAAGVVIGDRPLDELVPLYRDPKSDMPVTQFNMKYVEQAGLVKFDFLGLKTMTVIQKAVELVKQVHDVDLDMLNIPFDDEKTFRMLGDGMTVGVFQLESAGMRDTLKKLKPNRFEDIIALVALYRPGPMDNIPRYIDTKHGRVEPDYMHPKLQPFLEETYGIMIYQEQVLQAAQALSGYSLGSADFLRRAMGKKIKSEMDAQREMFVNGAKEHSNLDSDRASEIFDQIAKFAGYGFNKAHATAYALIAYWTGWLKANYPVEFMAASMTLDAGNTDKLAVFKQELDRMDITLLPPDINRSGVFFSVEDGCVRYALCALKGVGEQAMKRLEALKPFKDLEDFAARMDIKSMNKRQFENLAAAGAFDSMNPNRAQMHGSAETILRHAQTLAQERESGQVNLFGGDAETALGMPDLAQTQDWDNLDRLRKEFDAVGFYLSSHPLDTKRAQLDKMGVTQSADIPDIVRDKPVAALKMAGVLLKKQEKISSRGNKYAFLQLSDSSGVYEVTLFAETLAATRDFLEAGQTLYLKVTAEERDDQIRLTASSVEPLDPLLEKRLERVEIHLETQDAVRALKALLERDGAGRSDVVLCVSLDAERKAEILLSGRWAVSEKARNDLRRTEGIISVLEA